MAPNECCQHEAKTSSFIRRLCCWRSLSLTTVVWLNRYRPAVETPCLPAEAFARCSQVLKTLGETVLSSLPRLPCTGNVAKGSKEFSQTSPFPKLFSKQRGTSFSKRIIQEKKKIPVPSHVSLVPSREGERNVQTFPQPLWFLISLREAPVPRFCPSCHTLSWTFLLRLFIYFFPF